MNIVTSWFAMPEAQVNLTSLEMKLFHHDEPFIEDRPLHWLAEMVVAFLCRTVLQQRGHPSRSWRLKQPLRGTAINKSTLWPRGIMWQEKTLKHSEFGKNAQEYFLIAFSLFCKMNLWDLTLTCQDQKPDGRGCPAGGCNLQDGV